MKQMPVVPDLKLNLEQTIKRIRLAEQNAGRPANSVKLLAVSKVQPITAIRTIAGHGHWDFGENYLQEALEKIRHIDDSRINWHFIGHLQSNKTAEVAQHFAWIHSIDRVKIARRLSRQRPADLPPLNCCLQVNIQSEQSKSGLQPSEVANIAEEIQSLANLQLRGLMAIPRPVADYAQQRRPFARLRELLEDLRETGIEMDTLSMGMSADLEAAIHEGATWVRIGTDVFGPRLPLQPPSPDLLKSVDLAP